jgi:hypothetical protein
MVLLSFFHTGSDICPLVLASIMATISPSICRAESHTSDFQMEVAAKRLTKMARGSGLIE